MSPGRVVNSYEYDAYGQRLSALEGVEIAFGYTGREYDAESGLMHYRARTYDPTIGRFLQTDPLGFAAGDMNLYRYVFNNPVNFTDPSGRVLPIVATAILGCVTGAGANLAATAVGIGIALICEAEDKISLPPLSTPKLIDMVLEAAKHIAPPASPADIFFNFGVSAATGCIAGATAIPAGVAGVAVSLTTGFALGFNIGVGLNAQ